MTADDLAPCVARSTAAMILNIKYGMVCVLHERGCQLPTLFREMTEDAELSYVSPKVLSA